MVLAGREKHATPQHRRPDRDGCFQAGESDVPKEKLTPPPFTTPHQSSSSSPGAAPETPISVASSTTVSTVLPLSRPYRVEMKADSL